MIIIISGCDRTGKTTLCQKLVDQLSGEYIHFSVPESKNQAEQDYLNFIKNADINKIYVVDRFYECEQIYAPLYRGYKQNNCLFLDFILRSTNKVLFVYVYADLEIIKQRINKLGDNYVKEKDLESLLTLYQQYMNKIQLPYLMLKNSKAEDLYKNLETILSYYKFIENNNSNIFGNLQAKKAVIFNENKIEEINITNLLIEDIDKYEILSFYEEDNEYKWNRHKIKDNINYNDYLFTDDINTIKNSTINIDNILFTRKV